MPETSLPSICFIQLLNLTQLRMNESSHHQLGDSITFFYVKALGSQVNDNDADLAPIVWINCTGRIYKGNAMLYRQPAAWCVDEPGPHTLREALWQFRSV